MLLHRITPLQLPVHSATSNWAWAIIFSLVLMAQPGQAQFEPTIRQSAVGTDSTRGYWRLKTQAATRSTLVQFFGANGQLLYVEDLPGKYVKLSRKNQKQFDQLLEQLLANQLVSARIKTEALPPTPAIPTPSNVTVGTLQSSTSVAVSYQVHAYVNPIGKLYLIVDNPDRLRYKILVADQRNRPLYEEFTNHDQYRRRLDLSTLPDDDYQLIVQIDNKPLIYKIRRQGAKIAYVIQPEPIVRTELMAEQIRYFSTQ